MNQFAKLTALAVTFGMSGCSNDGAPSYAKVSGTVTYNGQPLSKGQITFSLEGRAPTMVEIVDGKYSGQAMIGSNRVQIAAFRKRAKERALPETAKKQIEAYQALNKSGGGGKSEQFDPSMEDYIPADYGRESKQTRVVEKGGENSFDFNIKGS
jgi:hypothetical protein